MFFASPVSTHALSKAALDGNINPEVDEDQRPDKKDWEPKNNRGNKHISATTNAPDRNIGNIYQKPICCGGFSWNF